jgi:Short-chain dehydrogenases of various substrate specificities
MFREGKVAGNWGKSPCAVFVTGAGSGIGACVAEMLASRGHRVFGGAFNEQEATTLASVEGVTPIRIDVRDEDSARAAATEVRSALAGRPLNAVLNIAGMITNGPVCDLPATEFANVLAVNLVGVHTLRSPPVRALRIHQGGG